MTKTALKIVFSQPPPPYKETVELIKTAFIQSLWHGRIPMNLSLVHIISITLVKYPFKLQQSGTTDSYDERRGGMLCSSREKVEETTSYVVKKEMKCILKYTKESIIITRGLKRIIYSSRGKTSLILWNGLYHYTMYIWPELWDVRGSLIENAYASLFTQIFPSPFPRQLRAVICALMMHLNYALSHTAQVNGIFNEQVEIFWCEFYANEVRSCLWLSQYVSFLVSVGCIVLGFPLRGA